MNMETAWQVVLAALLVAWVVARLWLAGKAGRRQTRTAREYRQRRASGDLL